MTTRRPVIFGEVLFDCFEDGSRVPGGAPFNVAWHLAAFGLDPLLVSRVGKDAAGEEIIAAMHEAGMRTDGVGRDETHATGEVKVTVTDGQPGFDIVDDRAWDYITPPAIEATAEPLLYHGTLALRHETCRRTLDALLATNAAPVFMDVNLRSPWWRADAVDTLIDRARWLKINDAELAALAPGGKSPVDMAAAMLERHRLERIIVTCGARGAFTMDVRGDTIESRPDVEVPVVDTVGAGDAFAAVCIMGIVRRWTWPVTMARSLDFASVLVARRGAIVPERAVYLEHLDAWS